MRSLTVKKHSLEHETAHSGVERRVPSDRATSLKRGKCFDTRRARFSVRFPLPISPDSVFARNRGLLFTSFVRAGVIVRGLPHTCRCRGRKWGSFALGFGHSGGGRARALAFRHAKSASKCRSDQGGIRVHESKGQESLETHVWYVGTMCRRRRAMVLRATLVPSSRRVPELTRKTAEISDQKLGPFEAPTARTPRCNAPSSTVHKHAYESQQRARESSSRRCGEFGRR